MNELNNMKNNGPSCDSEWLRLNGNCYYFSVTKWNWRKSRFLCVTKGSDLAVINDDMEQRFISLITFGQCYWIGLSYKEDEGGWSWVDGTDYNTSYKSWNTSKRNDLGKKEECAQLSVYGEWNNVQCSYNQCYAVCEMKQ
ncbi:hepatic lectin-like [Spea bombifrons]|uniref:hepatic lectin-like n=1 Tax=Spea bombifrons TaxID=233779 RepID=UPI0023497CAF|nr:hepatic lectin-like [Spea bombifrons]